MIQSYELYERLKRRLVEGESNGEAGASNLTQLIDQLAGAYPRQLLRLYQELQAGDLTEAGISSALSAAELALLVETLLSVNQQAEGATTSDLITAIERYAGHARDLKGYYRRVLESLVQNQNIDFEEIIESQQPVSDAVVPDLDRLDTEEKTPPGSRSPDTRPTPIGVQATEDLLSHLREGSTVSEEDLF